MAGLGNPGSKYSRTRHNIGFMVLEVIADRYPIDLKEKGEYIIGRGSIEGQEVVLVKPLTFMNRSGLAVGDVLRRFNVPVENMVVIHDDLDMETGKLKIRKSGSSGGHKGIESIIQNTGTREFIRVKIGIGREPEIPAEDYVLSKFKRDEIPLIKDAIKRASDAVVTILQEGVGRAMNRFNRPKAFS